MHVFDLPAPVVGSDLNGLDGLVVVPCLGVSATGGQIDFEGLEDNRNAILDVPVLLLDIGLHQLLGLADFDRAYVDGGGVGDAGLGRGEHDGDCGVALVNKVRVLGLVLLFVGSDGPDAEVVDLLVRIIGDRTVIVAALRLKNANGFSLTFDGAALRINGFDILIEEDDCGGIFIIGRRGRLGGIDAPLRDRLRTLAKDVCVDWVAYR